MNFLNKVQALIIEQKMDNKADILGFADLSVDLPSLGEESRHLNSHINAYCRYGSLIDLRETHSRNKDVLKKKGLRSVEEMGIPRDFEEETIKERIYHLALRLHQLYQQQREKKNKTLLEVNISIKMEGVAKIEIKETKKEDHDDHEIRGRPRTARSENMMMMQLQPAVLLKKVNANNNTKKFDWVKSLRSNAAPVGNMQQHKTSRTNRCCYVNLDVNNARRICSSTASTSEKPAGQGLRQR